MMPDDTAALQYLWRFDFARWKRFAVGRAEDAEGRLLHDSKDAFWARHNRYAVDPDELMAWLETESARADLARLGIELIWTDEEHYQCTYTFYADACNERDRTLTEGLQRQWEETPEARAYIVHFFKTLGLLTVLEEEKEKVLISVAPHPSVQWLANAEGVLETVRMH
jgi:hypothetical protein